MIVAHSAGTRGRENIEVTRYSLLVTRYSLKTRATSSEKPAASLILLTPNLGSKKR